MLIGAAIGSIITAGALQFRTPAAEPIEGELHRGQREFVNPLIDCPQMPDSRSVKTNRLQNRLQQTVDKFKSEKKVEAISIGFRDLLHGSNLRINVDEPFAAASLLKVPILITIMQNSLTDPGLLSKKLVYSGSTVGDWVQNQSPAPPMTPGSSYTVEELLRRMIMDSDNSAASMLLNLAPPEEVIQDLRDMGVVLIQKDNDWWISVGEYGSIFRILYNSTFLPANMSNGILKLLSQASLKTGLVSPIGTGIPVAHKFGERRIGNLQQFHDCGIVYFPKSPYLLCVMSRGADLKQLESAIGEISKVVFEEVSNGRD